MKRTRPVRVSAGSEYAAFWRSATYVFVALWALLIAPLAFWGLPSKAQDDLLFRGSEVWPAASFGVAGAAEERRNRAAGADVDRNPIEQRTGLVELTDSVEKRAEILMRYRLYSRQPDEMISFQALQRMNPRRGDFDPRLYQYGGGYLYSVGLALGAAHAIGFLDLRRPIEHYLDHPQDFAKFYMVSRLLTVAFGVIALLGVGKLAARLGGPAARFIAVALVAFTPVFINASTEAKPHLASAAFLSWSAAALVEYARRERRGALLRAALLAGLSFGFVLTGLAALLPLAALALREMFIGRRASSLMGRADRSAVLALCVALAVFALLNPYMLWNAVSGGASLGSNLSNSTAMYDEQLSRLPQGALRAMQLLVMACGYLIPLLGIGAILQLLRDRTRGLMLGTAGGLALLALCVALGAGKPAEFARFLIAPTMIFAAAIAAIAARVQPSRWLVGPIAMLGLLLNVGGIPYLRSLWIDLRGVDESRRSAAASLLESMPSEAPIGVLQEPAPYATPPLDFALRRVVLLPSAEPSNAAELISLPPTLVVTADSRERLADAWWQRHYRFQRAFADTWRSPISWANKPVYVFERHVVEPPPPAAPGPAEPAPQVMPTEPPPVEEPPAPASQPTTRPRRGPVG